MAEKGQNKYMPGMRLGPNEYLLVERVCHPERKRPNTHGIFECSEGHRFEAGISNVVSGRAKCRECNPNPWFKYKDGSYIGSHGIFLIKRTTKNDDGSWNALMRCHCGNEFEHDIYSIALDVVKSCGCLAETGQFQRKFKPGDLLGPNQILFLGYTGEKDSSGSLLGEFQCPHCPNTYISRVSRVAGGEGHYDCGCQEKERRKRVGRKNIKDDLEGRVFGKLTVIRRTDEKAGGSTGSYKWECECACGNTCFVPRSALLSGNTQSCGCAHIEHAVNVGKANTKDLSGKMFGYLEPLYRDGTASFGVKTVRTEATWRCLCHNCGKEVENVPSSSLFSGNKISCGCARVTRGEKKIIDCLEKLEIKFDQFKSFDTCRNPDTNYLLTFDFYLPEENMLIEFDGKQHFSASNKGWNTNEQLKINNDRDVKKNKWCSKNKIPLLRIPYSEYDKISPEYMIDLIDTVAETRKSLFVALAPNEKDMRPIKF